MFLNATSTTSLAADFSRLHDLLGLKETDDKISAVKRCLCRKQYSQWLMVFDNADDLVSVPVSKYFPVTSWGHIIITTRDQAASGSVTEEGCTLGPLTSNEAVKLLLGRAGIRQPSSSQQESAEEIVRLLGFLPLAINQAGAFMRSRCRSPNEFLGLYLKERLDILRIRPRLGDSEISVLTTWEVNFKQVENDSKDATTLLLLFCFLEPSAISEVLLHRGSTLQRRWHEDGEVTEVSAEVEGLDRHLTALIQNETEFDTAIEKLLSYSLISCNKEIDGLRSFSVHPLVQYCTRERVSPATANTWRWQAILLICHAFPRNRYIEPL